MKISNFEDNAELEDIKSLQIIIKAVPYENSYLPVFVIMSPDDDYNMSIDEINSLMDGVEIAKSKLDEIINYILRKKIFMEDGNDSYNIEGDEQDDIGTNN
jgi:hypothetical protein